MILLVMLAASRQRSSWGPTLAEISIWGLAALVVWAILPRWRSVLPRLARPLVSGAETWAAGNGVTAGTLAGARWLLGDYERWRAVHRVTGLFVAAGFVHGLLDSTAFGSELLRWTYIVIGAIGLAVYAYRETMAGYFLPLHDYQVAHVTQIGPGLTEIGLTPIGPTMHFVPGRFAMCQGR